MPWSFEMQGMRLVGVIPFYHTSNNTRRIFKGSQEFGVEGVQNAQNEDQIKR